MHFRAILNREGGTLRTIDVEALAELIRTSLAEGGHSVEVKTIPGAEIAAALETAANEAGVDAVIAGGGDGTVSAAAAALKDTGKPLAILPAGTMNLFARSLGIALNIDEAVHALVGAQVRDVDVASANGRVFTHQYSIGMHAKMVKTRDKLAFSSRLGKIRASCRAAFDTIVRPPSMRVAMKLDERTIQVRSAGIGIANNLFGEGHLPYASNPAGGTLGIYITTSRSRAQLILFVLNVLIGRWERNPLVEIYKAREVELSFSRIHARHRCAIDGELAKLENPTTIRIHAGALRVLVPAAASAAS